MANTLRYSALRLTGIPQASVTGTGNRSNLYIYVGDDPLSDIRVCVH